MGNVGFYLKAKAIGERKEAERSDAEKRFRKKIMETPRPKKFVIEPDN